MQLKFPQSSFHGVAEMFSPFGPPCGCFAVEVVCGGCNGAALQVGEMPYMAQPCSLELNLPMNIQTMHLGPGREENPAGRTWGFSFMQK